ncbi:MAG: YhfC family intramembrane metalloprotease [Anaerolineaceae bacterium]|nr:YhfC family intramembrane metalloprotease [Anaerolineaceae bacterium]
MDAVLIFFVIMLIFVFPLGAAMFLRRRFQVSWLVFAFGTLSFLLSQVVHLPLNNALVKIGWIPSAEQAETHLIQMAIVMGLTAGLCEELARTAFFAFFKRWRRFEDGIFFGLGHGGVEAMIIGAVLTADMVGQLFFLNGADLTTMGLTEAQIAVVETQLSLVNGGGWQIVYTLLERVLAMMLHIGLTMVVWKAFQSKKFAYIVAAILYHALVDFIAVVTSVKLEQTWMMEGVFFLAVLPGIIFTYTQFLTQTVKSEKRSSTWYAFTAAVKKEWMEMWRNKSAWVILAIFAVFAMLSPLMAYFMPQMLGSIEGAEQFADLIPEPSVVDANVQYVKNLTQFGFIIVILIGMARVAGEKERGTAEMLLHKPLPRWAFILSKFTVQVVLYAIALFLAWVFGSFYTWYLFDGFNLWDFTQISLIMFVWLLPFVGVTLLGSTLGKSIGTAAGISFGGAALLLVLGSIPKAVNFVPAGLMGWMQQLVNGQDGPPMFATIGACVLITVLCVIWSIGIFEQQEI